jgi:hypothetical protein
MLSCRLEEITRNPNNQWISVDVVENKRTKIVIFGREKMLVKRKGL